MENHLSGTRTVGVERPSHHSGGVFRETATMRRVHRAIRRILSFQASGLRHWTQTIHGGETRACKIIWSDGSCTLVVGTRMATKDLARDRCYIRESCSD